MSQPGCYDGTLQMFVEAPRTPVLARLEFLRWLAEGQALEHPVAGPPSGDYARLAPQSVGSSEWPIGSWPSDRAGPGRASDAPASSQSGGAGIYRLTRWSDPAEQW